MRVFRRFRTLSWCTGFITVLAITTTSPLAAASTEPYSAAHEVPDSSTTTWAPPVLPLRIIQPFIAPATRYASGHRGIDIAAVAGTQIIAAAAGSISFSGMVAGRPVVSIDHGNGVISSVEPVDSTLKVDDQINQGDQIGTVADGGHCAGSCIHFGVRLNGEYVSPFLFLGGIPRAVLLPL